MLLTPGPTPVPEFVRKAMADITIHHRTPEFEAIFKETRELLLELFDMDDCVILASSGTGAMEACVTNLCHKKALTINSGKFGERFGKICQAFNIPFTELKHEWNTAISVDEVVEAIKNETVFAYGLDVYNGEPKIHPEYLKLKNIFLLPHLGSATKRTRWDMAYRATKNLEQFFSGKKPQDQVN